MQNTFTPEGGEETPPSPRACKPLSLVWPRCIDFQGEVHLISLLNAGGVNDSSDHEGS